MFKPSTVSIRMSSSTFHIAMRSSIVALSLVTCGAMYCIVVDPFLFAVGSSAAVFVAVLSAVSSKLQDAYVSGTDIDVVDAHMY